MEIEQVLEKVRVEVVWAVKIGFLLLMFVLSVLLFSPLANAQYLNESHNLTDWQNDGQSTLKLGVIIEMTLSAYLNNVSIAPGDTSNTCYIYTGDGQTLISQKSITGLLCQWSPTELLLNQTQKYRVVVGGTGSWTARTTITTPSFPINGTRFRWLTSTFGTGPVTNNDSSTMRDIRAIGFTVEETCVSNFTNISYSDWQDMTLCTFYDQAQQNRTYLTVDLAGCEENSTGVEFRNGTCDFCSHNYTICNVGLEENIEGGNNMIALVMAWLGLMGLGYWMLRTGNLLSGWFTYSLSLIFDFMLMGQLYKTYAGDLIPGFTGQLTWVFFIGFFLWAGVKIMAFIQLQARVFKI